MRPPDDAGGDQGRLRSLARPIGNAEHRLIGLTTTAQRPPEPVLAAFDTDRRDLLWPKNGKRGQVGSMHCGRIDHLVCLANR